MVSTIAYRATEWVKRNSHVVSEKVKPFHAGVITSLALHFTAFSFMMSDTASSLVTTLGAVALGPAALLIIMTQFIGSKYLSPAERGLLSGMLEKEREAVKDEAVLALESFGRTGKSNLVLGQFLPRAEFLEYYHEPETVRPMRTTVWTEKLAKYARGIKDALCKVKEDDPLKKFQKAFDYLNIRYMPRYRLNQSNLYRRLEGKGGNCESQAKLFISLVDQVYDWDKSDWKPAVANYTDHLEVVLYNHKTGETYDPSRRKKLDSPPTSIFDPHLFLAAYLKGRGVASPLFESELLLRAYSGKDTEPRPSFNGGISGFSWLARILGQSRFKYDGVAPLTAAGSSLGRFFMHLTSYLGPLQYLLYPIHVILYPVNMLFQKLPRKVQQAVTVAGLASLAYQFASFWMGNHAVSNGGAPNGADHGGWSFSLPDFDLKKIGITLGVLTAAFLLVKMPARAKNWTIRIALVGLALFAGVKTYQAYQEYGFCQIACESSVTAEGKPKPYAFFANDGEEGGWDVTQCEPSFAASFASRNSRLDSVVHSYVEILTHDQTEMSDMAKKDDREYGIVHLDPSVLKRSRQVLDHCEEAFQFKEELKARVHTVDFLVVDLLDRCHDYRLDRSRFIGDFFGTVRGAKVLFDLPTAEAEQAFASLDKKERFEVASYLERLPWAAADDPSGKLKGESRSLDPGAFDKETVAGDGGSDADTKKGTSAVGQEIPNAKTGEETLAGKKGKTGEEDKAGIDRKKLKGEEGDDLQSKKGTTPEVEEIVKALEGEQSLDGMIGKTGKENTPGGTEETKERLASEGKEVIPIHIYFVDIKEERARTSPLLDEKARVKEEMRRTSALLERVKKSLKAPKPAQISAILAAQYLEWLEHNFPGETFTWGLKARLLASPYAFLLPLEERIQWQREVAEGGPMLPPVD